MLSLGPGGKIQSVGSPNATVGTNGDPDDPTSIEIQFLPSGRRSPTTTTPLQTNVRNQYQQSSSVRNDPNVVSVEVDGTSITIDEAKYADQPVDLDQLLSEYETSYRAGQTALNDDDVDLFTQAQVNMEPVLLNNSNWATHYQNNTSFIGNTNNKNSNNNGKNNNQRRRNSTNNYDVGMYDEGLYDDNDDGILFERLIHAGGSKFYSNPNRRLLDNDASLIPGSPFSKPANKLSNRPSEPLTIAKYASTLALLVTLGWVGLLFFRAIWEYDDHVGRVILEIILSSISFLGLFWNTYFSVSSILKCFIPKKAFLTNTKYCSIIPESKDPKDDWFDVTIQIPVYKESLQDVIMPTLKSCIKARDHYEKYTQQTATCNIVVCDDGMMAMLHNNFPAAAMLWESIQSTAGKEYKLGRLLKQNVPRASRMHLKGLRSKNVYEVFYRMLFYYHYNIGWVARSTIDRRGKFKKASNLNSHLRLAFGAQQIIENQNQQQNKNTNSNNNSFNNTNNTSKLAPVGTKGNGTAGLLSNSFDHDVNGGGLYTNPHTSSANALLTYEDALIRESHNEDGSRYIMFGNNIKVGDLIVVNDADARMCETVIHKTVPEFLNDKTLGFTQHTTKTLTEQRNESYFTRLLAVYTDALYQGHFLLSSILGCHPPLVGHSIFIRTDALKQCGRVRTLRKAQQWLKSIGLQFLPVDQVGFGNLQADNRTEYWSENHVSEDFELMIHLYSLGFNGRYIAYPDCEFQEGITRYFDEEAGRHRKFALGAHELIFNPFQDMIGKGIFTPVFRIFLSCDIPSYYKIFLSAYLCSYASGGAYIIVFTASAIARILNTDQNLDTISAFSPAGIIVLNFIVYYVLGFLTFIIALLRMNWINQKLLFKEYRRRYCGSMYLLFTNLRYGLVFQFLFYNVATFTFYFLGSMDHMFARPNIVGATNKDSITITRARALYDTINFNLGSWFIAVVIAILAYLTVLQESDWDYTTLPDNILPHALFAGPAFFLSLMTFVVPIILNPWILGWPFLRRNRKKPQKPASARNNNNKEKAVDPDGTRKLSMIASSNMNNVTMSSDTDRANESMASTTMTVDLTTLMKMNVAKTLTNEMQRAQKERDVEIGSVDIKTIGQSTIHTPSKATKVPSSSLPTKLGAKDATKSGPSAVQRIDPAYIAEKDKEYNDSMKQREQQLSRSEKSNGRHANIHENKISELKNDPYKNPRSTSFDDSFVTKQFSNLLSPSHTDNKQSTKTNPAALLTPPPATGGPGHDSKTWPRKNGGSGVDQVSSHSKKSATTPVFVSANAFSSPPVIKASSIVVSPQGTVVGSSKSNNPEPTPLERRVSRQIGRSSGNNQGTPETAASATPSPVGKRNGMVKVPLPRDKWGFPQVIKDSDLESI